MRKTIFVIDPVCPKFYDLEILKTEGMGASESYLLYNLVELINNKKVENYQFIFFQDTREEYRVLDGINNNRICFERLDQILEYEKDYYPQTILLQRDPRLLDYLHKIYPKSSLILYCHDFYEGGNLQSLGNEQLNRMFETGVKLVGVSKWHMNNIKENLKLRGIKVDSQLDYNYFYFNEKIKKEKRDKYKICYFSGHHKGLGQCLTIFKKLKEIEPKFKLIVASPKYSEYEIEDSDGVELKYNISRSEVLKEINTSLCLLHPNNVYPETFGCVNMEANKLGIPVLCYDFGATGEIITDKKQFIKPNKYLYDPENMRECVNKILSWSKNPPIITKFNEGVDKNKVINKWLEILTMKY